MARKGDALIVLLLVEIALVAVLAQTGSGENATCSVNQPCHSDFVCYANRCTAFTRSTCGTTYVGKNECVQDRHCCPFETCDQIPHRCVVVENTSSGSVSTSTACSVEAPCGSGFLCVAHHCMAYSQPVCDRNYVGNKTCLQNSHCCPFETCNLTSHRCALLKAPACQGNNLCRHDVHCCPNEACNQTTSSCYQAG